MPFAFMPCALEITVTADLSESMWNLAPQPLKTLYLHRLNAYDHQTWQRVDLPKGLPPIKSRDSNHVVSGDHEEN